MTTTTETADFTIIMDVLSVGKGDLRLSWDKDNPEDVAKAAETIQKMLREGYGIFVETDDGLARVKEFNARRMTYLISELPDDGNALAAAPAPPPALPPGPATAAPETAKKKPGRPKKAKTREVPVAGSRSMASGRTAGG